MVQRRGNIFTHIFLIFIIAVILFPVVWVVTTSLRRDEAAFSSKLFTSRLTLQHYRDLVAPEKNLPFLVQDLQAMISKVKPYDTWSEEELKDAVGSSIEKVKSYLSETEARLNDAVNSFERVDAFLNDHSEEIKNRTIEEMRELLSSIQIPDLSDSEENRAALYLVLSKERYNSTAHKALKELLERFTGVDTGTRDGYEKAIESLKESYEKLADGYDGLIEETQRELNAVKEEMSSLRQQYSDLQDDVMEANLVIEKDIIPELERIKISLSELNNLREQIRQTTLRSPFPVDDEEFSRNISETVQMLNEILDEMSTFAEYDSLKDLLVELKKSLQNSPKETKI